jgi:peptidoglycan/LPS O-acetylase OafA/YrhL
MSEQRGERRQDDISHGSPLDGVEVSTDESVGVASGALSYDAFRDARHYPALDGLRALSVALVYFFHTNPTLTSFLSGWEGVTTFFLLSGFLITTLLLREHENTGGISLKAFYIRRILRIFPLYYIVLGIHYVLIVQMGIGQNAPQLRAAMPWDLTYMSEWGPHADSTPFAQSWTLGIEEKYYLVWPFVIGLLLHRSIRTRFSVVVLLTLLPILTLPLGLSPGRQEIVFTAYGRILIGCVIALCLHERRIYERLRFLGGRFQSLGIALAFVGSLLLVDAWKSNLTLYGFPFVAGLLLVSLIIGGGLASKLLSPSAVRFIGTRAYGIYLLDSLANRAAGYVVHPTDWPRTLLSFGLRFAIALLIADVLFRTIERPLIAYGKRLSHHVRLRLPATPLASDS